MKKKNITTVINIFANKRKEHLQCLNTFIRANKHFARNTLNELIKLIYF